jgi:hypothetical protein
VRAIDRDRYGSAVGSLIRSAFAQGLPATLAFAPPVGSARAALRALPDEDLGSGQKVRDSAAVVGLRAGLWLLHDFMDEAHDLAQTIEDTASGAYWHAIVHRREPDPSNARYWFDRVGAHAIFPELLADARVLAPALAGRLSRGDAWHAADFVKLATGNPEPALTTALVAIARREWELLFDHEWSAAFTPR